MADPNDPIISNPLNLSDPASPANPASPATSQVLQQLTNPGSNPNDPANYTPSSGVSNAVAPVIAQITGGNAGNTIAGIQGAQKADSGFFGDIAASVQKVTSQISAAFNAGKSVGSDPTAIAGKVNDLATQKAAALVQSGQAGANVIGMDALSKAAADAQKNKDAVMMHLDPNSPDAIQSMTNMADSAHQFNQHIANLNQMRQTGFFDNPAEYLINHVVNIPIEEGRARDSLGALKGTSDEMVAQTQALGARSVVDDVVNSPNTINRATEAYKQALGAATAAGIEPLMQGQQIQIGAYELGVAQQNAATSRGQLAIAQAKLPGELEQQKNVSAYYGAAHDAMINQLQERANLEHQNFLDKVKTDAQNTELTSKINGTVQSFGGQGNITDLNRLNKQQLEPLSQMSANLNNYGSISDTPAHSYELLSQSGINPAGMPAGHINTYNSLSSLYNEATIAARSSGPNGTPLPTADTKEFVNSYVSQKIQNEENNISSSNKLLAVPSVGTLVEQPWAKNNPILTAMRPLAVDGSGQPIRRDVDGSLLINTAAKLVADGKITDTQAASSLKDIAHNILNDDQTAGGFKRFAIPLPNKFNMQFNKAGIGFGDQKTNVDLFNSADTLAKIRLQVGGMKASQIGNTGLDMLPGLGTSSAGDMIKRFFHSGDSSPATTQGVTQ